MFKGVLGWERLLVFRNTLVSRVVTIFSLSVIVLSSFVPVSEFLDITWRFIFIYAGSLLFFGGYVYSQTYAPKEFKDNPVISDIILRMKARNATIFFESRIEMAEHLVNRISSEPPSDLPDGVLDYAKYIIQTARKQAVSDDWRNEQGELYYCDLNLRQYDRVKNRCISAALMAFGFSMILIPTLVSILLIPVKFLKSLAC